MPAVPEKATVLVVGGGPAGSFASSLLTREGVDVVLLEAGQHPKHHVGESLLPSMRHYLRLIDCEKKFEEHGFMNKPGAVFKLNPNVKESFADFRHLGATTWNVVRSECDELLINHSAEMGTKVFQNTRVESVEFDNGVEGRPVSVNWKAKDGTSGNIKFDYLVDASGRQGLVSTKYLKNRIIREGLRNTAAYGYWKKAKIYDEGGYRSNAAYFEALRDRTGWVWAIPLHDGTTSVGVVMHEKTSKAKKQATPGQSMLEHYHEQLKLVPGIGELLQGAELVDNHVRGAGDYSYHATSYSGDHYRIIGDAAAFVDPLFSSGFHVAMTGALSAAATIMGSIKGQVPETEAQAWHDAKIGVCQTRFLLVVLSAYKEMQSQENYAQLGDVDARNFADAFSMFGPVIRGSDYVKDASLSDVSLDKMINFARSYFHPTTVDMVEQTKASLGDEHKDKFNIWAPVLSEKDLDEVVGDDKNSDARQVLERLNSLRMLRQDTNLGNFTKEAHNGYVVNLDKGSLGLIKAEA